MASMKLLVALALIAAVATPALATDFVVGDDKGWTINFDYRSWAADKEFHVGDKLVFKYPPGVHDVNKVDLASFQNCTKPATTVSLTTGNDVITLATEGKKWYLCSVGSHCKTGNQKLAITVLAQVGSPAASPSPSSSTSAATGFAPSTYFAWITAAFGALIMIIMA